VEAVERSTSRPSTEDSRRTGELRGFFPMCWHPPMRDIRLLNPKQPSVLYTSTPDKRTSSEHGFGGASGPDPHEAGRKGGLARGGSGGEEDPEYKE
jgi:hypothetical protein